MELRGAGDALIVLTTLPDETSAEKLARALVDEGLAACVNIVPGVRSIYRWQGQTQDDRELLCLIKTTRPRLESLAARVRELHPYEVPELLTLSPEQGAAAYLDWLVDAKIV